MNTKKHHAPGKSDRVGMSILQLFQRFPDEQSARTWFENVFWSEGRHCGRCGSMQTKPVPNEKPMPYWCSDCRNYFSVKTGTPMQASNIPLQKWVIAMYMMATNLKGVSSMKIHRELGISQKSAWHMMHRIREIWNSDIENKIKNSAEVDETYMGGKEGNKHESKKLHAGRGATGKTAVVGIKERKTKKVVASVIEKADKQTLQGFVATNVEAGSQVFTDDALAYKGMIDFEHHSVKHSVGEYVNGIAHTNGIESFWSMLKRGYQGIYHKMSKKHLERYVNEFVGRHNMRELNTIDQMATMVASMKWKTLPYKVLVGRMR